MKPSDLFDPFTAFGLDLDVPPEPTNPEDLLGQRTVFNKRKVPETAWDAFASNRLDHEEFGEQAFGLIQVCWLARRRRFHRGLRALASGFTDSLTNLSRLWWAAQQRALHLSIRQHIEFLCCRIHYVFPILFGEVGGCSWPPGPTNAPTRT